jgi:rhamnulose-1-phosphate aldolase
MNDNFFKYIFEAVPLRLPQLIDTLSDIASRIWQMGWAEANAGNVSINITQDLKDQYLIKDTDPCHYYLVSRTGSRYRQISRDPMAALVLICVADNQDSIYPIGARPTSEWNSHKALQKMLGSKLTHGSLHVHPDEVIASQICCILIRSFLQTCSILCQR